MTRLWTDDELRAAHDLAQAAIDLPAVLAVLSDGAGLNSIEIIDATKIPGPRVRVALVLGERAKRLYATSGKSNTDRIPRYCRLWQPRTT